MTDTCTVTSPNQATYNGATRYFINKGQALACTATQTGQETPLYQWQIDSVNAAGTGNASSSFSLNPTVGAADASVLSVGAHNLRCGVYAAGGWATVAFSIQVPITVNAALVITIVNGDIACGVGESVICRATISGGNVGKTYQWFQDEASLTTTMTGAQTVTLTYVPTTAAIHALECAVTDDATVAQTVESNDTNITVSSILTMLSSANGYLAKIAHAVGQ